MPLRYVPTSGGGLEPDGPPRGPGGAPGTGPEQGAAPRPALADAAPSLTLAGAAPPPAPKLRALDVHVHYPGHHALRGVSLDIPARQVTALIGPSGCGKSTFLRCLNRLHDLTSGARVTGRVLLDGADIYARNADPVALRRRVGMVFQRPNPFPCSIYDNVAFGLRLQGYRDVRERVQAALVQAGLWPEVCHRLRAPATALSGGQQQRLCLARALAPEPEVLLLDEPTSALDPAATAGFEALVGHLRRDYTLVLVTHNLGQARRLADRVACFAAGALVAAGPVASVLTPPADPRSAAGQKNTHDD